MLGPGAAREPSARTPHTMLSLILCLASSIACDRPLEAAAGQPVQASALQLDAEYEQRRKAAGSDIAKLWELHEWCVEQKKEKESRATLRQIIKLEPNHRPANEALGYVEFDGKWFPSQKKVDEYKKSLQAQQDKAQGLVDYKGKKVPAADVPFLEKGLVKDDAGNWVDAQMQKRIKEGWVQQDLEWIAPQDKPKLEQGLWKCGEEWLALDAANQFHAEIDQWWRIPLAHAKLLTTCDRAVALEKVKRHLELAWPDLVKAYGQEPKVPVNVVVLRDLEQYSGYAAGDQEASRTQTESRALSSIHYAYFAELAFDPDTGKFLGAGVSYWDASNEAGNKWGTHAVRHALAESFAEAIDPSPQAVAKLERSVKQADIDAFFEEKRIPPWFRHGVSSYVERYFVDKNSGPGENPLWARNWSIGSIASRGGLRPLKQLFATELTVDRADDASKLLNELGLIIAFALDGGCAPVSEKLAAVQAALAGNQDKRAVGAAVDALEAAVIEHEVELRKFAGL
jgi:hypothetical protein